MIDTLKKPSYLLYKPSDLLKCMWHVAHEHDQFPDQILKIKRKRKKRQKRRRGGGGGGETIYCLSEAFRN